MFQTLKLLLPALIPSWRFFDEIAPSPRIEFTLLKTENAKPQKWQEFRPRPETLSILTMIKRMAWNPRWNETLFLVSCSERLMQTGSLHSEREIFNRIKSDTPEDAPPFLQFRLVFISRNGDTLKKHIPYISQIHPLRESV